MNKSGNNKYQVNKCKPHDPHKQIREIDIDAQCQSDNSVFYFRDLIWVRAWMGQGKGTGIYS